MKILNREITVANKFIFYYANFVEKIYGYVIRRDGRNIPEEHYVGRLKEVPGVGSGRGSRRIGTLANSEIHRQGDPLHPDIAGKDRWIGIPEKGEIVLCLYRKHLLVGCFQEAMRKRRYSLITEDHRTVIVRSNSVIYLTGVSVGSDHKVLQTYASSVRGLADHIDLVEIWALFRLERKTLTISDLATLYWEGEVDPSRWIALYLHLESVCPYFESDDHRTYLPLNDEEVGSRKRWISGRESQNRELAEFLFWLQDGEAYDSDTLTSKQKLWLQQVRNYALWGSQAKEARQAKKVLASLETTRSDLQHFAFDIMVEKGIWDRHENLDLIRSEYPTVFTEVSRVEAKGINLESVLGGRSRAKSRRGTLVFRDPVNSLEHLAFSIRKKWFGGYEAAVHVLDVSSYVPKDSPLDADAADRMGSLKLPDQSFPLYPIPLDLMAFQPGEKRPALTLVWQLDKELNPGSLRVHASTVTAKSLISAAETEAVMQGGNHSCSATVIRLKLFSDGLGRTRLVNSGTSLHRVHSSRIRESEGEVRTLTSDSLASRIVNELGLFAATEIGKWCRSLGIPSIYLRQDPPERFESLKQIPNPVVRTHELQRQTPAPALESEASTGTPIGEDSPCSFLSAVSCYPDLIVQRQIAFHLQYGEHVYDEEEMRFVCYRATEELAQLASLQSFRERYVILKHLSIGADRVYSAVVLHISRKGTLVQLLDFPLKTIVHPPREMAIGDPIELRASGVDLWHAKAHFLVQ